MPLSATNFVTKGPVLHADMLQFYNLFTGTMTDQPVTFGNTLQLGGNQSSTTVPLKVYGSGGQTTHLLDLYTDHSQTQPGWGIGAAGSMAWGASGTAPLDTFLSRVAQQNGHSSDTAGLLIAPYLEVTNNIQAAQFRFANGTTLTSLAPSQLTVTQDLVISRNLYVGTDLTQYFHEQRAAVINAMPILTVGANADPWGSGIGLAESSLVVRANDLADTANASAQPFSAYVQGTNWLQFNVRFSTQTTGQGWPGKALWLAYDVDNSGGAGGYFCLLNGRIGVNMVPGPAGAPLQVAGNITASGSIVASAALGGASVSSTSWIAAGTGVSGTPGDISANRGNGTGYVFLANGSHYIGFDGSNYQLPNGGLGVTGNVQAATFNGQTLPLSGGSTLGGLVMLAQQANGSDWKVDYGVSNNFTISSGGSPNQSVNFHAGFSTVPFVIATIFSATGSTNQIVSYNTQVHNVTTNGFQVDFSNSSGSNQTMSVSWIAIGR